MKPVVVDIVVQAPPEAVWRIVSDIEHGQAMIPAITSIEILGDRSQGLGTRWRETRVMFGREATETLEITEWRPPREYVVSAESHGCRYRSVIRVRPQGPGTVIEFEFGGEPYTFMSRAMAFVMGGLMRGSIEKMLRADLAAMKDFCERHA